jgi:hypothetical protein
MQLVLFSNSSGINGNYWNNVLTVASGIPDVISVSCYFAFIGLVQSCSPKLGLSYLKIKARGAISNLINRPRASMQLVVEGCGTGSARFRAVATRVVGEVVRACRWQCSNLRWPELMVEAAYGGQSRLASPQLHSCLCIQGDLGLRCYCKNSGGRMEDTGGATHFPDKGSCNQHVHGLGYYP